MIPGRGGGWLAGGETRGKRADEREGGARGGEGESSHHFLKERGLKSQRFLNSDPHSPPM